MISNPISDIFRFFRASSRLGAFRRALNKGAPDDLARAYSDAIYPPTPRQLEFESRLRTGQYHLPWGSGLGILLVVANLYLMVAQATAETGSTPPLLTTTGYGIAQLGYVLLAIGIVKGRFGILGILRRKTALLFGVVALICGTMIMNHEIWLKFA
jgi:hypothetical protein